MGKERKAHEPKHTTSSFKHDGASVMASGTGQQLLINDFLSEFWSGELFCFLNIPSKRQNGNLFNYSAQYFLPVYVLSSLSHLFYLNSELISFLQDKRREIIASSCSLHCVFHTLTIAQQESSLCTRVNIFLANHHSNPLKQSQGGFQSSTVYHSVPSFT